MTFNISIRYLALKPMVMGSPSKLQVSCSVASLEKSMSWEEMVRLPLLMVRRIWLVVLLAYREIRLTELRKSLRDTVRVFGLLVGITAL